MSLQNRILLPLQNLLGTLSAGGVAVAMVVVTIIAVFILPLPRALLDLLLSLNIAVSLLLLLRSLFVKDSRQFFAFPALLLLTTLFRLGLNVSSSRLVLLRGHQGTDAAGTVIESFGQFVVSGDFVVGAILFALISTVNFLVIAKGAARVAEVAARFALDSLPGKQLALDAEMRAGSISRDEAAARRTFLTQESQFYGAMDGAMRFVQGDAIAGLLIAVLNSGGGAAVGVSRGLSLSDSIARFGVLAIGDGLVSILPALLISVSAGIVVTRVSGREAAPTTEILQGLTGQPGLFLITGATLLILALVPGMPFLPFFLTGLLMLTGIVVQQWGPGERVSGNILLTSGARTNAGDWPGSSSGRGLSEPWVCPIELKIGPQLEQVIRLGQGVGGTAFVDLYDRENRKLFARLGVSLPRISCAVSSDLPSYGYQVLVRERIVRRGELVDPQNYFVVAAGSTIALVGGRVLASTFHPVDRRKSHWVKSDPAVGAALRELKVEVLSTDELLIQEIISSSLCVVEELFGLDEIKRRVEAFRSEASGLVHEVIEKGVVSYAEVAEILLRLLRERVSVRDLKLILEGVAYYASLFPDKEDRREWLKGLHLFLRKKLVRSIIGDAVGVGGSLRVFSFSPEVEEEFRSAVSGWERDEGRPPIEPEFESALRQAAHRLFSPVLDRGISPIVMVCSAEIRLGIQEYFSWRFQGSDWFRVLAIEELDSAHRAESVGVVTVSG